jgi:hypothetical protein
MLISSSSKANRSLSTYIPFFILLFVVWNVRVGLTDILEVQDEIAAPWRDVPGPYPIVNGEYKVPIGSGHSHQFFRLRTSVTPIGVKALSNTATVPTAPGTLCKPPGS